MTAFWQNFHFIRPHWLWLLLGVISFVWMLWKKLSDSSDWRQICDPHLMQHLIKGRRCPRNRYPFVALALIWMLAIVALAGPTWKQIPRPVYSSINARVMVFDLSRSMNSTDLTPTRLTRAKFKLTDLIARGRGVQQALVVFAGDAFVVTPLTDDTATILNLIPSLDTTTVPVQGGRSDLGILKALELFDNTGLDQGEIILITDAVSPETGAAAERIASRGYRLSVLGVGTRQGAPVSLESGELLKDQGGNIVIPKLQPDTLSRVAHTGNGIYSPLTADDRDIEKLMTGIIGRPRLNRQSRPAQSLRGDQWEDYGIWLMIPILCLTAVSFRKGWIFGLYFFILIQNKSLLSGQPLVTLAPSEISVKLSHRR